MVAVTLAAFLPALGNGFVSWDDNVVITGERQVITWSWQNTGRIFTSFQHGLYHPLVTLSFAAEHRLFGFAPVFFHWDNLLLHLANTIMVYIFILLLGGDLVAAAVTALLFGLHPTRVESVAWVMERKDLLFTFFYFAALLLYLRKNGNRGPGVAVSIGAFTLSLLSKAAAISLPFVLPLIDFVRGRKIDRVSLQAKIPYFLLAALFGLVALFARILSGSLTRDPPLGPANIYIGSYRLLFYYLPRIVFPWRDFALYPGNTFAAKTFTSLPGLYLLAPVLAVLLGLLYYRLFRRNRPALFGGAFFLITLLPSLFLIPIGPFADRFTYVPAVGIFYLFGLAVTGLWRRGSTVGRVLLLVAFTLLITSLVGLTGRQIAVWHDSVSLWDRACQKYPRSAEAFNQRGLGYVERLELGQARRDLLRAERLAPANAGIRLNLRNLADVAQQRQKALFILNRTKNSGRIKP